MNAIVCCDPAFIAQRTVGAGLYLFSTQATIFFLAEKGFHPVTQVDPRLITQAGLKLAQLPSGLSLQNAGITGESHPRRARCTFLQITLDFHLVDFTSADRVG